MINCEKVQKYSNERRDFMRKSFLGMIMVFFLIGCEKNDTDGLFNFKSAESKERYSVLYNSRLSQWEIPYTKKIINTNFGKTALIECGNSASPPLVLLHGFCGTATMWKDVAELLATDFHIFALDIMGDVNMSEPSVRIEKSADFAQWLVEAVHGLGLKNALFIGESYGAWQIMNCAYRFPDIFQKAIAVNPMPGITDFTFKGNLAFMYLGVFPTKNNVRRFLQSMVVDPGAIDDGFVELFNSAFNDGKMAIPSDGYVLSNDELKKISFPMFYVFGDRDFFAAPKDRLARERDLNSNSKMTVIKDAGHDLVLEKPEIIAEFAKEQFK
jgi:pimeloyl-ACP methyl ester carboxylesterase